jgi:hypothetical protein
MERCGRLGLAAGNDPPQVGPVNGMLKVATNFKVTSCSAGNSSPFL